MEGPVQPLPQQRQEPKQPVAEYKLEERRDEERGLSAALFVKLDKYKGLLSSMGYLKTSLVMLRSSLTILKDLDKLREENLRLLEEGLEKMEKRLANLDSDFLRPSGFREEAHDVEDVHSLEGTIEDLKSQIEQLKSELGNVS
jgi:predicted  nucleic acid-binding Zn-ribbon protein